MHVLRMVEYGPAQDLINQLSSLTGLSTEQARRALHVAGWDLQRRHALPSSPLQLRDDGVVARGIAGVLSLYPGVDLEIVPKFADPQSAWSSDLLFLSLVTQHASLDPTRPISATSGDGNSLADIAAATLLGMIERNGRTPLRIRRRVTFHSYEPNDEIDPADLLVPDDDGWRQSGYRQTNDNPYVATLACACRTLQPHVRSASTKSLLAHQIARFGKQTSQPLAGFQRLPARLARWQHALDLARALIGRGGLHPTSGSLTTIGFTIDTWRAWEALLERGLLVNFGGAKVTPQSSVSLGTSTKGADVEQVNVRPDALIDTATGLLVLDAKYKGRFDQTSASISAADRYELLAHLDAVGTTRGSLLYPDTRTSRPCGAWDRFETFDATGRTIHAYSLSIAGIASQGGFSQFLEGVKAIVRDAVA